MLIKTENLVKKYGDKTVINHLNLEVEKGQLVAYIGTNGAGKSTTIGILTGLLKPTSGMIQRAKELRIGMVFQSSILDDELMVLANLKSRASLYKNRNRNWFNRLIELFDLSDILKQPYGTLSGGQKRRVDIARALINQPNLLFLDEPTTGLDVQTRQAIWGLLRRLQREEGLTIFLTTHYLEEAENADMTYIIDKGKALVKGSAKELKEQYAPSQLIVETNQPDTFRELTYETISPNQLIFKNVNVKESLEVLTKHRQAIQDFAYKKGDMNDVYLTITGTRFESQEEA